jgi:hypothetical protein
MRFSYIIYQGTDILPEIFSSSPHTRVFVARKLHEGVSPRVILSDKHVLDCKKKFLAICVPELADQIYSAFSLVITESNSV